MPVHKPKAEILVFMKAKVESKVVLVLAKEVLAVLLVHWIYLTAVEVSE